MPIPPDWRAEKSAALIKHICHVLNRAKASGATAESEPVPVSRADLAALLGNARKLYCDACEEMRGSANTWSPELPDYLLAHPETCDETLRLVADEDYRDPYYDPQREED